MAQSLSSVFQRAACLCWKRRCRRQQCCWSKSTPVRFSMWSCSTRQRTSMLSFLLFARSGAGSDPATSTIDSSSPPTRSNTASRLQRHEKTRSKTAVKSSRNSGSSGLALRTHSSASVWVAASKTSRMSSRWVACVVSSSNSCRRSRRCSLFFLLSCSRWLLAISRQKQYLPASTSGSSCHSFRLSVVSKIDAFTISRCSFPPASSSRQTSRANSKYQRHLNCR